MNRDFKGVWIEKDIWLNTELTILEKVIYAEIDSLDNENHCTASNEYFAEFCDCSTSKVSKAIKKLQELGMIDIMSFDGRHRRIRLVKNARQTSKKCYADSQKMLTNNIDNKQTNNKISISKDIDNREIEWFLENYHSICVSLPKVMKLS
jgi:MarR-like DNA-binding transcriptional regulator SgrR of sgrS sRNA